MYRLLGPARPIPFVHKYTLTLGPGFGFLRGERRTWAGRLIPALFSSRPCGTIPCDPERSCRAEEVWYGAGRVGPCPGLSDRCSRVRRPSPEGAATVRMRSETGRSARAVGTAQAAPNVWTGCFSQVRGAVGSR